jgi:hypothetical protein
MSKLFTSIAARLFLLVSAWSSLVNTAMAEQGLSPSEVRAWMAARITTHQIQNRYKANASLYEDVIAAFYKEREQYLRGRGYTPSDFEKQQLRIFDAYNYLVNTPPDEAATESTEPEQDPNIQETIAMLRQVGTSEAVIEKMLTDLRKVPELQAQARQRQTTADAAVQADIVGVRAWLGQLRHLQEYLADNRADPPVLYE